MGTLTHRAALLAWHVTLINGELCRDCKHRGPSYREPGEAQQLPLCRIDDTRLMDCPGVREAER